jgi:hypothetical protein
VKLLRTINIHIKLKDRIVKQLFGGGTSGKGEDKWRGKAG